MNYPLQKKYWKTAIIVAFAFFNKTNAQLANGTNNPNHKFLGNIIGNNIPSNYLTYWNQVTPENSGKWGSIEGTRNVMNWANLTSIYNFANSNNIPIKQHTFIWGNQEPSWVSGLSEAEQLAEVTQWIDLYAAQFPNVQMIDVVNEPLHSEPSYKNALTNAYRAAHPEEVDNYYDWVLWAFEKARAKFPTATLLINDYNIINSHTAINSYLQIVNLLKAKGLIDGIGIQCHEFSINNMSAPQVTNNLNLLAAANLPIYVSELDISGTEAEKLQRYQTVFPALWEHPAVAGITLWGYIYGQTWKPTTGIINNGVETPSMVWLKQYLNGSTTGGGGGNGGTNNNITIRARGTNGTETINITANNITVASYTLTTSFADYTASGNGTVSVQFTNDNSGLDVVVDYAIIDGTIYEAEDQKINTGAWDNTAKSCGFSYSENLHCNGYIEFSTNALSNNKNSILKSTLSPNPANNGDFEINLPSVLSGNIQICDLNGKIVYKSTFENKQNIKINTPLSKGLYIIQISNESFKETKKLIVN